MPRRCLSGSRVVRAYSRPLVHVLPLHVRGTADSAFVERFEALHSAAWHSTHTTRAMSAATAGGGATAGPGDGQASAAAGSGADGTDAAVGAAGTASAAAPARPARAQTGAGGSAGAGSAAVGGDDCSGGSEVDNALMHEMAILGSCKATDFTVGKVRVRVTLGGGGTLCAHACSPF